MKKSELKSLIKEVIDECGIETQLKNRLRDERFLSAEVKKFPNDAGLKSLYDMRKFLNANIPNEK